MHIAVLVLGVACAGTVILTAATERLLAVLFSWVMVSIWASANLAHIGSIVPFMSIVELPAAIAAYVAWWFERERWQIGFATIMGCRIGLYTLYPGAGAVGEVAFFHVMNFSFVAALAALCWTGGVDVLASNCLRKLRRFHLYVASHSGAVARS